MSYDFQVRFDDDYSSSVSIQYANTILLVLENIRMVSEYSFVYDVPKFKLNAQIYLERFNSPDSLINATDADTSPESLPMINCILICVPYAYKHGDEHDQLYILLGLRIAQKLGWKLHDEQTDLYITEPQTN